MLFWRSLDARKKPSLFYVYCIYVTIRQENSIVKKLHQPSVSFVTETGYRFSEMGHERLNRRPVIVGCMIFLILYHVLPESMYPYIGMIGGIGVGYSAGYAWQTVFNTFGALSIASGLFGAGTAVTLRIIFNVMGSVYTVVCDRFLDFLRKRTEIHRVGEMA